MEDFIYEEAVKEVVVEKINNEIEYLDKNGEYLSDFRTLSYLQRLRKKDVKEIVNNICSDIYNNEEINKKINEIIENRIHNYIGR